MSDTEKEPTGEADGANTSDDLEKKFLDMEETMNEEKKRLKDPLYCHLCSVQCSSPQALVSHSRSVIHMERVAEEAKSRKQEELTNPSTMEEKKKSAPNSQPAAADNKIRCELCNCECSGEVSYQAHIAGSRHQKNLRNQELGEPLRQGPTKNKKTASGASGFGNAKQVDDIQIQSMLDSVKEPLIGLQYMTEFRDEDPSTEAQYVCNLCEITCNFGNVVSHVMGTKHRFQYLKEHYMNYYVIIRQKQCKKSELTPIVDEYARTIEADEGRQKLKAKVKLNPFYRQAQGEKKRLMERTNNQPAAKRGRTDGGGGRGAGGGRGGGSSWGNAAAGSGRGRGAWGGGSGFGWNDTGDGFNRYNYNGFNRNRRSFKELLSEINNVEILSEEDASLALQVSNSLTQKLLEYRLQNVPMNKEHVVSEIMGENWRGQMSRGRPLGRGGYQGQRGGGGYRAERGSSYGYGAGGKSMLEEGGYRTQGYDPWGTVGNDRFSSEPDYTSDDYY